ncbi:acetylcholine receptor subunit beta-type lev-1-like, partial [Haliotis rubra]|uniref:acetylcholine receptor subunit beta-type lev-1-like n=1 Tax=Haliotis rubra TaxID=36100 RepID=UPI001EE59A15
MCLLSFLNSFVFLLPASSGEKMGYLMSVFVSNALFLSLIHDTMPSTSDSVPKLSLYLTGIQIQGFLAIAATILVQNIYHKHQNALEKGANSRLNQVVPLGSADNAGSSTPASLPKHGDSQPSNGQCMMRKHGVPLDRLLDVCVDSVADSRESVKQLRSYLETRFNPEIPPIDPNTNVINVDVTIGPLQVQDLVDATQVLKFRVFVMMSWKDSSLAWNASDYPNVLEIEVAPHKVWRPNVFLVNAAAGDGPLSTMMPMTLFMNGSLYWQNIMMVSTICKTDLSRYPFDNQTCDLIFSTAFGYPTFLHPFVNSNSYGLKLNTNGEWQTVDITPSDSSPHEDLPYQAAIFNIHLSRKPFFYILNFICPMCLVSFLNSFVFLLPASSGEKVGYLMAVFVSNALFLSLVHEIMPSTSDTISHLSLYLVGIQVQGFLGIIATIVVQNVYSQKKNTKEDEDHEKSNQAHAGLKLTQ